jgi:hypothetical protein
MVLPIPQGLGLDSLHLVRLSFLAIIFLKSKLDKPLSRSMNAIAGWTANRETVHPLLASSSGMGSRKILTL